MKHFGKTMRRALYAFATTFVATTLGAQAATAAILNQGDEIILNNATACTTGYVDKTRNVAWTAAHCGPNGAHITNKYGESIGILHHRGNPNDERSDVAEIHFIDGSTGGDNLFTGDHVAPQATVNLGDRICAFGKSTGHVNCGSVGEKEVNVLYSRGGAIPIPGDSGGPAWVDGKGFVGVTTRSYDHGSGPAYAGAYTALPGQTPDPVALLSSAVPGPSFSVNETINQFSEHSAPTQYDPFVQADGVAAIIRDHANMGLVDAQARVDTELAHLNNHVHGEVQRIQGEIQTLLNPPVM